MVSRDDDDFKKEGISNNEKNVLLGIEAFPEIFSFSPSSSLDSTFILLFSDRPSFSVWLDSLTCSPKFTAL